MKEWTDQICEKLAEARPEILVVDDDPSVVDTLRVVVERAGYVARCARDGGEALAAIREKCPALVLLDLRMPRMDGFEFLAAIQPLHPELPVLLMSGVTDHNFLSQRLEKFGHLTLLTKPFTDEQLLSAIKIFNL